MATPPHSSSPRDFQQGLPPYRGPYCPFPVTLPYSITCLVHFPVFKDYCFLQEACLAADPAGGWRSDREGGRVSI